MPACSRGAPLCLALCLALAGLRAAGAQDDDGTIPVQYRWVYRNPLSGGSGQEEGGGGEYTPATVRAAYRELEALQEVPRALQYSHMGMLTVLPNGSLAAAWQAAYVDFEGSRNQSLYWALSDDGGRSWGPHAMLVSAQEMGSTVWAPVLHTEGDTVVLIFATSAKQCYSDPGKEQHWSPGGSVQMRTSQDSGLTWSKPRVIWAFGAEGSIGKMVANQLITNGTGAWFLPVWREMGGQAKVCQHSRFHGAAGVLISADQGETWSVVNVTLAKGAHPTWLIEGTLAWRGPNSMLQLFRTEVGQTYASISRDGGLRWTHAAATSLPNPNSKLDLIALPSGTLVTAYNVDSRVGHRTPLALGVSTDGGATWATPLVLENYTRGSFHYPTAFYLPQQDAVAVIYSVDILPPDAPNPLITAPAPGSGGPSTVPRGAIEGRRPAAPPPSEARPFRGIAGASFAKWDLSFARVASRLVDHSTLVEPSPAPELDRLWCSPSLSAVKHRLACFMESSRA